MASINTIPPELLLDILSQAISSSLMTEPLIVHGQFSQLASSCRTCCYRQIAGVCSTWATIVREQFVGRQTVFGVHGSEADDRVLACVTKNAARAKRVKTVDASLRGWQGWKSLPVLPHTTTEEPEEETIGFLQTREVQIEKQRQQILERERQRLVQLLTACRTVEEFDIDVGFYCAIHHLPTLLPPTIRSLTLRNCDARETFDLIENLPLLEDLTLRLALDWRISASAPRPRPSCRLRRFELSFTAFATTNLSDVLTLLSSSTDSLTSLTLRNKGTSPEGYAKLLPVAAGLVAAFSPRLEHLAVKDIPRAGMRMPGSRPSWEWFPKRPTAFPRLRSLQLTGLPPLEPSVLKSTIILATNPPMLERLLIEDFDSSSPRYLVETLKETKALQRVKLLEVAIRQQGAGMQEAASEIEKWCGGTAGRDGRATKLRASWNMRKVDHFCGIW
ncbi:uncharacterized protein JCM15063_006120 [Sporobolomyces koalae]|uniref:uncharacterized protein n=1 Tax=Sporobolomyces koalae TaxID=500713 RepID=UPI00317AFCAF